MGRISAFETCGQGFGETENGRGEGRGFNGNGNAWAFNSGFFWRRARVKNGRGMSKLRDNRGAVVTNEVAPSDLERSHFESLGKGDR